MPTFDPIHLHMYIMGRLTQTQILALYPYQTSSQLTAALATRKLSHPLEGK